ncbi:MAG: dihydropteroate synthase [Candidatus Omnitrophica bacterium]|nr:dihydropteroate synthase [Candidatus Omnitrophota bacterium]
MMRISPRKIENQEQAKTLMRDYGVSPEGIDIMAPKSVYAAFTIEDISSWEANIIKQQLLSLGSDSAVCRKALIREMNTRTLIFGTVSQLRALSEKLRGQPFQLRQIGQTIARQLDAICFPHRQLRARTKKINVQRPVVCGIVNMTVDSFSGDGLLRSGVRWTSSTRSKLRSVLLSQAEEMLADGADMLDIGAESTRPFSRSVSENEERKRIAFAVRTLRRRFSKVPLSVDTSKYSVARTAVEEGIDLVNDVTALRTSPKIAQLVKRYKLGCVLMHMKGTPATMQKNPSYQDVVSEISDFFEERLAFCAEHGIHSAQLCLDPGIGFGKRLEDNLKIIRHLPSLKKFGLPLFIGISRKSFLGKVTGAAVQERLAGSLAAEVLALINGANILRVHDVKETVQAAKVVARTEQVQ